MLIREACHFVFRIWRQPGDQMARPRMVKSGKLVPCLIANPRRLAAWCSGTQPCLHRLCNLVTRVPVISFFFFFRLFFCVHMQEVEAAVQVNGTTPHGHPQEQQASTTPDCPSRGDLPLGVQDVEAPEERNPQEQQVFASDEGKTTSQAPRMIAHPRKWHHFGDQVSDAEGMTRSQENCKKRVGSLFSSGGLLGAAFASARAACFPHHHVHYVL